MVLNNRSALVLISRHGQLQPQHYRNKRQGGGAITWDSVAASADALPSDQDGPQKRLV